MIPDDLAQARADAQTDLAELEAAGVEPGTLETALAAERDRFSDLECDHGAALADELRDFQSG